MTEMNHKILTNKADEPETLSAEDEKIRVLLADLKRVEASKDFDFLVKARIAAEPSAFRPRFLPVLRYILPLGLFLLLSAGLVFNSLYFPNRINAPQIAENDSPAEVKRKAEAPASVRAETPSAPSKDETIAAAISANSNIRRKTVEKFTPSRTPVKSVENTKAPSKQNDSEISGGSLLSASTAPKQIFTPPGINPNRTVPNSLNPADAKPLTAKEVLSQLGVETVFENDGWKVLSVRQNSPAQRSGVKTGDAVQSIDGEKLTEKPMRNKIVEGKNLTVRRGANRIEISINN